MSRDIWLACGSCGRDIEVAQAKEIMFEKGNNSYQVMDVCRTCLDGFLQRAESVNDARGTRQQAAALVRLPGREVPRGQSLSSG